jgi:hypothetical protein
MMAVRLDAVSRSGTVSGGRFAMPAAIGLAGPSVWVGVIAATQFLMLAATSSRYGFTATSCISSSPGAGSGRDDGDRGSGCPRDRRHLTRAGHRGIVYRVVGFRACGQ